MITDPTLSSTDPKPSAPKAPKVIRITPRPALPIPQSGPVTRAPRPDGLPGTRWIDRLGRPLTDLRISVTDHCNFRCRYCMPKEKFSNPHAFLAHTELLTFEEILRIARIVVANGVEKLRLTGGEPLLRKGLEELVAELRRLRTPDGRDIDIALTTNASILHKKAQALRDAGFRGEMGFAVRSVKSAMRQAGKSGARFCLLIGEDELAARTVMLKNMDSGEQASVAFADVVARLQK